MASEPPSKRHKQDDKPYEIVYWPSIPGRGEPVRLCLEVTGTSYTDVGNENEGGIKAVLAHINAESEGVGHNPPTLAPPILKHGNLVISQLPNILLYLGPRLGLAGPKGTEFKSNAIFHINQLALTALDGFLNEAHDAHHPVGIGAYYEDQKDEAKKRSSEYTSKRLPKFLSYFTRVLQSKASEGGQYLYGGQLTYADLVLWQCLDGVKSAFPKAIARLQEEGKYKAVFELYDRIAQMEKVKAYVESERRQEYNDGIWRYYEELDED